MADALDLYEADLAHLCTFAPADSGSPPSPPGSRPVNSITPALLTKWQAAMTAGPTTRGMRLRSVSALFGWAVRMAYCNDNPAAKVDRPKERSRGAEAVISEADRAKLLAKASPTLKRMLVVLHEVEALLRELAAVTPPGPLLRTEQGRRGRGGASRPRW